MIITASLGFPGWSWSGAEVAGFATCSRIDCGTATRLETIVSDGRAVVVFAVVVDFPPNLASLALCCSCCSRRNVLWVVRASEAAVSSLIVLAALRKMFSKNLWHFSDSYCSFLQHRMERRRRRSSS
uniref:(northern house mosquito) hypothetical protein n=1 Tax=Culex pipiens TaxID=7175 RepID=A0A8D8DI49_CULPI